MLNEVVSLFSKEELQLRRENSPRLVRLIRENRGRNRRAFPDRDDP
jgi:hypothetical protein